MAGHQPSCPKGYIVAARLVSLLALVAACGTTVAAKSPSDQQPLLSTRTVPILTINGLRFRDADKDGVLSPFEDWRLTPAMRARDLVARMTLAEKAGTVVFTGLSTKDPTGMGPLYDLADAKTRIQGKLISALITRAEGAPQVLAEQHNAMQEMSEATRLGVPLILGSDPRHHFFSVLGASYTSKYFSKWPDSPGFGAINDPAVTARFADIARREYRAIGLQLALSPQADIASEPRWARVYGTFGDRPESVGQQVAAYIKGFQGGGKGLQRDGVLTVVKHWVGYGAAKDGLDSHSYVGRFADLSGGHLADHIRPFEYAFKAHVAAVMPTYSILHGASVDGKPVERVGAGFSRAIVTDLLRKQHGFSGLVISDSAITENCIKTCLGEPGPAFPPIIAMPWGTENLTRPERAAKAMNAGVDQILGLDDPDVVLEAVSRHLIDEQRLNDAAAKVLEPRFALGLFENPFVDAVAAGEIVGSPAFQAAALDAQRRSYVLLERKRGFKPLAKGAKVFMRGVDPAEAARRGYTVVSDIANASVVIVRVNTPFQTLYPNFFISRFQHAGDLDFKDENDDLRFITEAAKHVPVIVDVNLDRPAILTNIRKKADMLLANFGASDAALFDVLESPRNPTGRLPFELPSSMNDIRAQKSDAPHDSTKPLYKTGYRFGG